MKIVFIYTYLLLYLLCFSWEVALHVLIYTNNTLTPVCHKSNQKFHTLLMELKHLKSSFHF